MILGFVSLDLDALIHLRVRGPAGETDVEAKIDTGFNRFLTLPSLLIGRLALPSKGTFFVTLADGSEVRLRAFTATILWDGAEREVEILEGNGALIGMELLRGHRLEIEVRDGGPVFIRVLN